MCMKVVTRGFYYEYRLSVNYARSNPNEGIPVFGTLEEWQPLKSTKLDTAARLCQYFMVGDDLPFPAFSDGSVIFPAIPPIVQGETRKQETKIVIFMEFPSMLPLFVNVSFT